MKIVREESFNLSNDAVQIINFLPTMTNAVTLSFEGATHLLELRNSSHVKNCVRQVIVTVIELDFEIFSQRKNANVG